MKTLNIYNPIEDIDLNVKNGKYVKTFNTVDQLEDELFFKFNVFHGFKGLAENIFKLKAGINLEFGGLKISILENPKSKPIQLAFPFPELTQ